MPGDDAGSYDLTPIMVNGNGAEREAIKRDGIRDNRES
jgi:hypothetical protein